MKAFKPTAIENLVFEEYKNFFWEYRNKIAEKLTPTQFRVLSWYFQGDKPAPRRYGRERSVFFTRYDNVVDQGRQTDIEQQFQNGMKKTRAYHREVCGEKL